MAFCMGDGLAPICSFKRSFSEVLNLAGDGHITPSVQCCYNFTHCFLGSVPVLYLASESEEGFHALDDRL